MDKLDKDVQAIVDSIFKQKEELAMRKETENALTNSAEKINELVTSLEAKDEELGVVSTKVGGLEETVSDLSDSNKELEADLEKAKSDFDAEKEKLQKRAEVAEEELENIKKDQLAKARLEELTEAGVSATDETAVGDQVAKIREMEDDVFETYKAERVELRKSIITELEKSSSEEEVDGEEDPNLEKSGKLLDKTEAELEAEEEAVAASEESIDPMKAMAALLNMEITPSKDVVSKYRELGQAMADNMKGESK